MKRLILEMKEFYIEEIKKHTEILEKNKRKRNIETTIKVAIFCAMLYLIYLWANSSQHLLLIPVFCCFASLIILTNIDNRLLHIIKIAQEHISHYTKEMNSLGGDYSAFDSGERYRSATHLFSHDLDVFGRNSLYQAINRTVTPQGGEILADYLKNLTKKEGEIISRQDAVRELSGKTEWRADFIATARVYPIKNSDDTLIDRWNELPPFISKSWVKYVIYGLNFITVLLWILVFCGVVPAEIAMGLSIVQLSVSMFASKQILKRQGQLSSFIKACCNYIHLIRVIEKENFSSERLAEIKDVLFCGSNNSLKALSSLDKILAALDQRYNILVLIILDGLFMKSMHDIQAIDRWKIKYGKSISLWVEAVNNMDALISMGNFAYNHPEYTYPKISNSTILEAKNLCHPLLRAEVKVSNDFSLKSLHEFCVVTGANMAGKSTFLRSVGVNLILASSGNVVFSSDFQFKPIEIFTSMRTTDDLSQNSSYFHAELIRLKKLVDMAEGSDGVFIILDEILKGTNSEDKLNGSIKFLNRLLPLPISGLIATHDLALGDLAIDKSDNFKNMCFEITHLGDDIVYDYKIKDGVSKMMNASILLKQMGLI